MCSCLVVACDVVHLTEVLQHWVETTPEDFRQGDRLAAARREQESPFAIADELAQEYGDAGMKIHLTSRILGLYPWLHSTPTVGPYL